MSGECKDYSIDFAPGLAVFAMYKNAQEQPLFTVAKRIGPSGKGLEFVLTLGFQTVVKKDKVSKPKLSTSTWTEQDYKKAKKFYEQITSSNLTSEHQHNSKKLTLDAKAFMRKSLNPQFQCE